jgi:pseudaminic acid cytidylyltransferase
LPEVEVYYDEAIRVLPFAAMSDARSGGGHSPMMVAIIPARGGSKRIPRKNVKSFCGKPIIAWSITAALESGCFDRIVVSTDDDEIAEVAKNCGAETPFVRPKHLSDDSTGTIPVVRHAVEWLSEHGQAPTLACCVYATAPFATSADIRDCLGILLAAGAEYAFPVTTYPFAIQRALRLTKNGRVEMFAPDHFNTRSQDLEEAYHDAGQFYWGKAAAWLSSEAIFGPRAVAIRVPRWRVQDIDTNEDWEMAEYLFRVISAKDTPPQSSDKT